jgi:uroporphyrinogen decarboxylase
MDEYTFLSGDPDGAHQIWHWDQKTLNFHKTADTTPRRRPEDWPRLARERQKRVEAEAERARENPAGREVKLQKRVGHEMMVVTHGGGMSIGYDEASLMACAMEPAAVGDILDCQLEIAIARMEGIARSGIRVVMGGGDMAGKNGPLYSPQTFRDLILPRLKKLAARCNELGLHYVWRTDGNLWQVSDMIFDEAGVPGYGEVDRDAGMELGKIREKYPEVIVWANSSGGILRARGRNEVYDHCMEIMEESGGKRYFHGVSNTILPGTPPENVWAMMEARDDWGG